MLEKQSLNEFISHVNSDKAVIVSISPQSRASLASYFDLSPSQVSILAYYVCTVLSVLNITSCFEHAYLCDLS